ncbi:hypothetical protein C8A03DRAFT_47360 [Achaetomium macrosporum]|uniref:Uncharacterized protein n=1 Tax=Achaetomium macrosporum TaxID=79813 RepID=A0AAN7C2Z0_9PEZI|nr:hypothetical protein C8A03DRAFT_47360 [Achaetomium macrosporum]
MAKHSRILSWVADKVEKAKNTSKTADGTTGRTAAETHPIVSTILALHDVYDMYQATRKTDGDAKDRAAIPTLADAAQAVKAVSRASQFVPAMQVITSSLCDMARIVSGFQAAATAIGIGCNLVLTYQGVEALNKIADHLKDISATLAAQTALMAQKDFPCYVYQMVRERLGQTANDPAQEHWFFVFHPDDDWYPGFYHLLEEKPLDPRFCGYTRQIDTAFVFMLEARREIQRRAYRESRIRGKAPPRPVKLHLLMPAYQPILIAEALQIPSEIGDFVMEGRTNSNKPFVWLNLPEQQRRQHTVNIGHWEPPTPGWWQQTMANLGLQKRPFQLGEPRVLGTKQPSAEGDNADDDKPGEGGDGDNEDGASREGTRGSDSNSDPEDWPSGSRRRASGRDRATPLHLRPHPRRKRHHRHGQGNTRRAGQKRQSGSE